MPTNPAFLPMVLGVGLRSSCLHHKHVMLKQLFICLPGLCWEHLAAVSLAGLIESLWTHLKVDMPIGKAVGAALIEEVNVFDEQAEEGDDNLEERKCRSM